MPAPDIDMVPEVSSVSTDSACLDLWEREEWETYTNINASTHHVSRHSKQKEDSLDSLLSTLSNAVKTATFDLKTIYNFYC